jgi:hypothetical protein
MLGLGGVVGLIAASFMRVVSIGDEFPDLRRARFLLPADARHHSRVLFALIGFRRRFPACGVRRA